MESLIIEPYGQSVGANDVCSQITLCLPLRSSLLVPPLPLWLQERLKLSAAEAAAPLPQQLLRKFISYARGYVHPVLSQEARQTLQDYYLQLRQQVGAWHLPMNLSFFTAA